MSKWSVGSLITNYTYIYIVIKGDLVYIESLLFN